MWYIFILTFEEKSNANEYLPDLLDTMVDLDIDNGE